MKKIVILSSGAGSNTDKLCSYFSQNANIEINSVFTNKPDAGVIGVAQKHNVQYYVFQKNEFTNSGAATNKIIQINPDLIVLAGFLLLIPTELVKAFPKKIINIHPALLPKFGGKGMYGMNVHKEVIRSGTDVSGITIHYVDEKYDNGEVILQKTVAVTPTDSPESVARKIQKLEHEWLAPTIAKILTY